MMAMAMGAGTRPPDQERLPQGWTHSPSSSSSPTAAHSGATPAWAGGNTGAGNTTFRGPFQQIINESNSPSSHHLIQLKLKKLYDVSKPETRPINLTDSQVGEFVWEYLQVPFTQCIELDNQTGQYEIRKLLVKSDTDLNNVTATEPHVFKDHEIFAALISNKSQRVYFK